MATTILSHTPSTILEDCPSTPSSCVSTQRNSSCHNHTNNTTTNSQVHSALDKFESILHQNRERGDGISKSFLTNVARRRYAQSRGAAQRRARSMNTVAEIEYEFNLIVNDGASSSNSGSCGSRGEDGDERATTTTTTTATTTSTTPTNDLARYNQIASTPEQTRSKALRANDRSTCPQSAPAALDPPPSLSSSPRQQTREPSSSSSSSSLHDPPPKRSVSSSHSAGLLSRVISAPPLHATSDVPESGGHGKKGSWHGSKPGGASTSTTPRDPSHHCCLDGSNSSATGRCARPTLLAAAGCTLLRRANSARQLLVRSASGRTLLARSTNGAAHPPGEKSKPVKTTSIVEIFDQLEDLMNINEIGNVDDDDDDDDDEVASFAGDDDNHADPGEGADADPANDPTYSSHTEESVTESSSGSATPVTTATPVTRPLVDVEQTSPRKHKQGKHKTKKYDRHHHHHHHQKEIDDDDHHHHHHHQHHHHKKKKHSSSKKSKRDKTSSKSKSSSNKHHHHHHHHHHSTRDQLDRVAPPRSISCHEPSATSLSSFAGSESSKHAFPALSHRSSSMHTPTWKRHAVTTTTMTTTTNNTHRPKGPTTSTGGEQRPSEEALHHHHNNNNNNSIPLSPRAPVGRARSLQMFQRTAI